MTEQLSGKKHKCLNPQCRRTVPQNVDYCCLPCGMAHRGRYSNTGIHSEQCNMECQLSDQGAEVTG